MIPEWDIYQWALAVYLVLAWFSAIVSAALVGKPQKPYGPGRVVYAIVWALAATWLISSSGVLSS